MGKINLEVGLIGLFPTIAAFATETSLGHPALAAATFGAGLIGLVKASRKGPSWPMHRAEIRVVKEIATMDRTIAPLWVKGLGGMIDDDGKPIWFGFFHRAFGQGSWALLRLVAYVTTVAGLGLVPMFILSTAGALTGSMAGVLLGHTLGGPIGTILLGCLLAGRWTESNIEAQAIAAAETAAAAPAPKA